jgi:hypothetical protein
MVKRFVFNIIFLLLAWNSFGQGKFDRKIIIEDSVFYAIEINNQLGILWTGNVDKPLDSAQQYILPVGTKRRSMHLQPLAWDISGERLYAINFTEFSQNEIIRNLKEIPLDSLEKYQPETNYRPYFYKAAMENNYIENYPFVETYRDYLYMDNFFFDIAVKGDSIYELIAIDNQITVWFWNGHTWYKSTNYTFDTNACFSTFFSQQNLCVIDGKGNSYFVSDKLNFIAQFQLDLPQKILVDNRDNNTINYIQATDYPTQLSIKEIISRNK